MRLEANPQDKLLPGLQQMLDALSRMALTPDKRSGEYLFWVDTGEPRASAGGLAIASLIGLCIGVTSGVFPLWRASLAADDGAVDDPAAGNTPGAVYRFRAG